MAMVPTPTTPGMGSEEALYRGVALAQLRILKQQMQLGNLSMGTRRVNIGGGVELVCVVCGNHEAAYINVPENKNQPQETQYPPVWGLPHYVSLTTKPCFTDAIGGATFKPKVPLGVLRDYSRSYTATEGENLYTALIKDKYIYRVDTAKLISAGVAETSRQYPAATTRTLAILHPHTVSNAFATVVATPTGTFTTETSMHSLRYIENGYFSEYLIPYVVDGAIDYAFECFVEDRECFVLLMRSGYVPPTPLVQYEQLDTMRVLNPDGVEPLKSDVVDTLLLCFDTVDKTWTRIDGPTIGANLIDAIPNTLPEEPLPQDYGLFYGMYPTYWSVLGADYLISQCSKRSLCAVPGGRKLGILTNYGVQGRTDFLTSPRNGYSEYSLSNFVDQLFSDRFHFMYGGWSDIYVRGGQSSYFEIQINSKTTYEVVDSSTVTVMDQFNILDASANGVLGQYNASSPYYDYVQGIGTQDSFTYYDCVFREFPIGLYCEEGSINKVYAKELYYGVYPWQGLMDVSVNTANYHGYYCSIAKTQTVKNRPCADSLPLPLADAEQVISWHHYIGRRNEYEAGRYGNTVRRQYYSHSMSTEGLDRYQIFELDIPQYGVVDYTIDLEDHSYLAQGSVPEITGTAVGRINQIQIANIDITANQFEQRYLDTWLLTGIELDTFRPGERCRVSSDQYIPINRRIIGTQFTLIDKVPVPTELFTVNRFTGFDLLYPKLCLPQFTSYHVCLGMTLAGEAAQYNNSEGATSAVVPLNDNQTLYRATSDVADIVLYNPSVNYVCASNRVRRPPML